LDCKSDNGVKITVTGYDGAIAQAEGNGGNLQIDLLNDPPLAPQFGVKFPVALGSIGGKRSQAEQADVTCENVQILVARRTVLDACAQLAQHRQANADSVARHACRFHPLVNALAAKDTMSGSVGVQQVTPHVSSSPKRCFILAMV
jgi:hypothetical protein